jgi:hypothetical protein
MNISHVKSNTIADFTGTVSALNSAGVLATVVASALVLPSDWNSAHAQALTIGGNTAGQSTWSGTNLHMHGGNNVTLALNGNTLSVSGPATAAQSVQTQGSVQLQGSTGAIVFSNSNGLSFGGNGSTITASHNGITSQSVQTQGSVAVQGSTGAISFSNSNGISFGGNGSTITASHNGLTSQSGQAVSAANGSSAFQTLSMVDTNGVSWATQAAGLGATVRTDYASSNHSHGNPSLALTNLTGTTASNSAGLTISLSAGAGGGAAISAAGSSQNAGTVVFSNSNGVSFGMNGSTITATVQPGAAAGIAAGSAGTQQATSGTLVFANSNGITFGMSGSSQITASHNGVTQQSTQPVAVSGQNGSFAFSTLSLSNANGISFGTSAGSAVTASYTVPTVTNSSWTVSDAASSATVGRLAFTNLNGLTLSLSTGAAGTHTIVGSHNALTTGAASNHSHGNPTLNLTNLSGTTASNSAGLTLSLSADAAFSAGLSGGNTAGDTGTVSNRIVFAGGNNITVSGSTNAGGMSVTISGANAGGAQTGISGIQVSDTTYTSGTVNFSNANGISFGSSAGQAVTVSHALQFTSATSNITSNALHSSASRVMNIVAATNSTGGGTASLSSNVSFSNTHGVSFFTSAGNAIVASHNGLTTARASNDALGLNTAQTNVTWTANSAGISLNAAGYAGTGTSITGGAAITLNSNGLQFNGASLAGTTSGFTGANLSASITHNTAGLAISMSAQAPGAATLSVYGVSNTTQSSSGTIPGSALSFQGNGGVSVGVSNGSVVLSGPALTSLAVSGALSASSNGSTISLGVGTVTASIIGNTTQTSTGSINLNALVFSGAGGASLGISAGSIIVSGGAGAGGGTASLYALGNTTQNSSTALQITQLSFNALGAMTWGYSNGSIQVSAPATSSLVGTGGISISTNGSTISISITQSTKSGFNPYADLPAVMDQVGQGSLRLEPMGGMPNVQFDRILLPIYNSQSSNSSGSHTLSFWVGFYTRNASTLSLMSSISSTTAVTHSGTAGSYSNYSGMRHFAIASTGTLTAGDYVMAFLSRTTSGGTNGTYSNLMVSGIGTAFQGFFGSSNNTTQQYTLGQGFYTATTSGLPASIAYSDLRGSDTGLARAPMFLLASSTV